MAVYGYIRSNTEEFINAQKELIKNFSTTTLNSEIDAFYEDLRISGLSLTRPGLNDLRGMFVPGDVIVVADWARISRDQRLIQEFLSSLKDEGVALRVVDPSFDTKEDGYVYPTFLPSDLIEELIEYQKITDSAFADEYDEKEWEDNKDWEEED